MFHIQNSADYIISTCFSPNEKVLAYCCSKAIYFFKLDDLNAKVFEGELELIADRVDSSYYKNYFSEQTNNNEHENGCEGKSRKFSIPSNHGSFKAAAFNYSRESFNPKYCLRAKLVEFANNHKGSFFELHNSSDEEGMLRESISTVESCTLRHNVDTYHIESCNIGELHKILFYRSFNELIQLKSCGLQYTYIIDYTEDTHKTDKLKVFKIVQI